MKLLITTFFIIASVASLAQKNEDSKNISTKKTDMHINIPGTKFFMIPPDGFEVSKSFIGLQKGDNYSIQIFDLDKGNFYTNAKNVSKKAFEDRGIEVKEYAEFKWNDYSVKYAHIKGLNNLISHQFIFGDTSFCLMILSFYPIDQEGIGKQVKESIFTSFYDKNFHVDPMATALFSVDESISKFKFHQSASNIFNYTIDGKKDTNRFTPAIYISQLPREPEMTYQEGSEVLLTGLKQSGFIMRDVESKKMIQVNGEAAYEKIFNGYLNDEKVKIYYLIFKTDNQFIAFSGIAYSDIENNINEFKKLSSTLKIK